METSNGRVAHPKYYNGHPTGVECITVIRHYVCDIANVMKYCWRAGLKCEEGMTQREKEIEDCEKALWYLADYRRNRIEGHYFHPMTQMHPCGVKCEDIAAYYCEDIAQVFRSLWYVGLIVEGHVLRVKDEERRLVWAEESLKSHILAIKTGVKKDGKRL